MGTYKERGYCYLTESNIEGHISRECLGCRKIRAKSFRKTKIGKDLGKKHYLDIKNTNMYSAKKKVYVEVRSGRLPKANTLNCFRCGGKASVYDHRDYSKPLEVTPLCRRCNKLIGKGLNRDCQDIPQLP